MSVLSFLDRDRAIAAAGYSRWLIPPAAWAVNLSIGQVYAFSVFKIPLTRLIGITHSAPGDWSQPSIAWIFSLAIAMLGVSAALLGPWIGRVGPRKAMLVAALFFGLGFYIGSVGVALHQLWLLYLGYGIVGGIGLGLGYLTPVATLIQWFPDRPGLATGLAMVGFGGGAMIGSPLGIKLMSYFHSPSSTGVAKTFLAMGTIYLAFMLFGAILVRVPPADWRPASGSVPPRLNRFAAKHSVSVADATRTLQFWLLWLVICLNSIAGFGILEQASPMIQDLFGIGPVAAGGFVGVLSLFNMSGRFGWSAASDYLGRRNTFTIFFLLGTLLYWLLPYTGANHLHSMAVFVLTAGLLISMYGGGFSTIPAYAKDVFGSAQIGAIYGRLQTATATAGILGPVLVNYSRQHQLTAGVSRAEAYQFVLHGMTCLLILGLVANLLVRPLVRKHWITDTAEAFATTSPQLSTLEEKI